MDHIQQRDVMVPANWSAAFLVASVIEASFYAVSKRYKSKDSRPWVSDGPRTVS
jgi:hypothetical protein